jgi:hypothetical protein
MQKSRDSNLEPYVALAVVGAVDVDAVAAAARVAVLALVDVHARPVHVLESIKAVAVVTFDVVYSNFKKSRNHLKCGSEMKVHNKKN